jgi:threonine/homoserine/homoserine lactone efflux protein
MDPGMLLRGLLIGFSVAAPVGPIGVLCIWRTLAHGRRIGLATGLGAATADALYGAVAGFGLTVISLLLVRYQAPIRFVGGVFLCILGLRTLAAEPATESAGGVGTTPWQAYGSALALTLANPSTILSFLAIFAGTGIGAAAGAGSHAALLVGGVFLGSTIWWVLLSSTIGMAQRVMNQERLRWVNRLSGTILMGFGAIALLAVRSLH